MKRCSPSAERNREPILEILREVLPARGSVLEIASGSGQHVVHFARALPELHFQPSDVDSAALESIAARLAEAKLPNVAPPLFLDVTTDNWPILYADAVVCINMIHIAPWAACEGLMRGAGRLLAARAPLVLYGPFRFDGAFSAPSNADFDRRLRAQDAEWGVRDLADVTRLALETGFERERVVVRPANNHVLVFRLR
jgi:hypothetical protein